MLWLRCLFLTCLLAGVLLAQASSPKDQAAPSAAPAAATAPTYGLIHELLQQGRYDDAIRQLQEMAANHPAGLSHELGTAYYKKGDYSNAITNLKKALEEKPSDDEATQLLGL